MYHVRLAGVDSGVGRGFVGIEDRSDTGVAVAHASSLRSMIWSLNCQPSKVTSMRPNCSQVIAGRVAVAQSVCVHHHDVSEQMRAEVEFMGLAGAVHEPDRFDAETLEVVEAVQAGDLGVEALATEFPVGSAGAANADDLVGGSELAAGLAAHLAASVHARFPFCAFAVSPATGTNAMQFTRSQTASMTCLSESPGTMRASHFEVSDVT